jgi:uncharacterized protein
LSQVDEKIEELGRVLASIERVAVAVSGGVDSMTLAFVANELLGNDVELFHAVSPAVPPEATARTRAYAARLGWRLNVIDAGEFADPDYLENPVNRCFYCKTNLYRTIVSHTTRIIVSGTNADDLSDFRPGLTAAKNHQVRHPYVEAGIDKRFVRMIASRLGLDEVAELPASPCLSSRIETGIRVDAETLGMVHAIENMVRRDLDTRIVRCRVRREGLVVELDSDAYAKAQGGTHGFLKSAVETLGISRGYVGGVRFERYRMGSAFLRA